MKLAMDADTARANEIRESMRHTKEQSILEDIRDLLYVNALNQDAMIHLLLAQGTLVGSTYKDKKELVQDNLSGADKILEGMKQRDKRTKRQLESMTQQYEQAKRRSGDGGET